MRSTNLHCAIAPSVIIVALALGGCSRDTRVNSDPGPGKPSAADGGDAAVKTAPGSTTPSSSGGAASVGTDSTGRPSDASGGTTGAGSGSKTSGTNSGSQPAEPRSQPR